MEYFFNIYQKLKILLNREIYKSVMTLVTGSAISQVIILLVMPFLTRIYPNEALSIFFVFSSIVAVCSILATLEYELAIILPKNDIWSINIFVLSLIINFFISIILLIIIALFRIQFLRFLNCDVNGMWIYFVPLSVFMNGIFQSFNYWFNRHKKYQAISISRVNRSVFSSATQITFSFAPSSGIGLIVGQIVGQFFSLFYFFHDFVKDFKNLLKNVSPVKILYVARRYKDIPIFNSTLDLMNSISNQIPIFLITKYFGLSSTSYYGLSHRIVASPMGVISEAIGQVFFQKASSINNEKKDLHSFVIDTYKSLFKMAFFPFLLILLFAPIFFNVVFSSEYENSGKLTQILIPWLFMMFLNSPVTFLITVLNRQRQKIIYDLLLLIFRVGSIMIGYTIFNDLYKTIMLFSSVGFIFNCFLMFYFISIAKKRISK